jgi:hypothetical protein
MTRALYSYGPVAALAGAFAASAGCGIGTAGELAVTDDGGSLDLTGPPGGGAHDDGGKGGFGGDDAAMRPGDDNNQGMDDGGSSSDGAGGDDAGPTTIVTADGGIRCNYAGTWATKITIPVNWVPQGLMSVILAPGSGVIDQWIMSTRTVAGKTTTDTAVVCGIQLPDFSGTGFVGGETYGVRFPNSLFDKAFIPPFAIAGTLSDTGPNAVYQTEATAALIGLKLPSAATTPWPATISTAVDTDDDMHPGVTATAAIGPIPGGDGGTYQPIPVDLSNRANQIYVVIRQVTALSGGASDCDHISGTVTIPKISTGSTPKYAIDSHIIGCGLVANGGDCSASQASFVDGTQPVFSPTAGASFTSVRMPNATCPSVRQSLP